MMFVSYSVSFITPYMVFPNSLNPFIWSAKIIVMTTRRSPLLWVKVKLSFQAASVNIKRTFLQCWWFWAPLLLCQTCHSSSACQSQPAGQVTDGSQMANSDHLQHRALKRAAEQCLKDSVTPSAMGCKLDDHLSSYQMLFGEVYHHETGSFFWGYYSNFKKSLWCLIQK